MVIGLPCQQIFLERQGPLMYSKSRVQKVMVFSFTRGIWLVTGYRGQTINLIGLTDRHEDIPLAHLAPRRTALIDDLSALDLVVVLCRRLLTRGCMIRLALKYRDCFRKVTPVNTLHVRPQYPLVVRP